MEHVHHWIIEEAHKGAPSMGQCQNPGCPIKVKEFDNSSPDYDHNGMTQINFARSKRVDGIVDPPVYASMYR